MQATLERLRQRREERGNEGGFTLIELLIVIVILAILAAIVVFAVQNLTGQSAKAACSANFKTAETGLEAYKAQVGHYPTSIGLLLTTATVNGATVGPWLKDHPPTGTTAGENYHFVYNNNTTSGQLSVYKGNSTTGTLGTTVGACANV